MSASHLDRELERALAGSAPKGEGRPAPQEGGKSPRKGNVGLLVVLLVMVGGIVSLVMTSFNDAAVYSKNVDQALAEAASLKGRNLRVDGNLVHGSLERRDQPCEYRFVLKGKDNAELPVRYAKCVVPDNFRDVVGMDVGVTVEGKLAAGGTSFEATNVLTKCPTKYEMKERKERGEQMPHQLAPSM